METALRPVTEEDQGKEAEFQTIKEQSKWDKVDEEAGLIARYNKRAACWEAVKDVMLNAVLHERAKGKGSRYRKHFVTGLRCLLRVFPNEDDEYRWINKFGRRIWAEHYIKSFNDEEKDLIITVIAHEMGAFDY
jgi:hypothetical protein